MKKSSYDPGQRDKSKGDYTPLGEWDNMPKHRMLRMFGGVDLGGDGVGIQDLVKPLELDKVNAGDFLYFGNSSGRITGVRLSLEDEFLLVPEVLVNGVVTQVEEFLPEGSVVGITVKRELNYLSKSDRLNPTAKGYDLSGDGITMNYLFYQGGKLAKYKDGGGALYLYPGSFYIVRDRKVAGDFPLVYNSIVENNAKFPVDPEYVNAP